MHTAASKVAVAVLFFAPFISSAADIPQNNSGISIVVLVTGQAITGRVVESDASGVVVAVKYGTMRVSQDRIATLEAAADDATGVIAAELKQATPKAESRAQEPKTEPVASAAINRKPTREERLAKFKEAAEQTGAARVQYEKEKAAKLAEIDKKLAKLKSPDFSHASRREQIGLRFEWAKKVEAERKALEKERAIADISFVNWLKKQGSKK